jgi:hypothetical protein
MIWKEEVRGAIVVAPFSNSEDYAAFLTLCFLL